MSKISITSYLINENETCFQSYASFMSLILILVGYRQSNIARLIRSVRIPWQVWEVPL